MWTLEVYLGHEQAHVPKHQQQRASEKAAVEKAAVEKAVAEKAAKEKAAKEKEVAEMAAAEKAMADKAAAEAKAKADASGNVADAAAAAAAEAKASDAAAAAAAAETKAANAATAAAAAKTKAANAATAAAAAATASATAAAAAAAAKAKASTVAAEARRAGEEEAVAGMMVVGGVAGARGMAAGATDQFMSALDALKAEVSFKINRGELEAQLAKFRAHGGGGGFGGGAAGRFPRDLAAVGAKCLSCKSPVQLQQNPVHESSTSFMPLHPSVRSAFDRRRVPSPSVEIYGRGYLPVLASPRSDARVRPATAPAADGYAGNYANSSRSRSRHTKLSGSGGRHRFRPQDDMYGSPASRSMGGGGVDVDDRSGSSSPRLQSSETVLGPLMFKERRARGGQGGEREDEIRF